MWVQKPEKKKKKKKKKKKTSCVQKIYCIWNPATCSCENRQYLASIIKNSVIMCDETTKETKTVPKTLF